MNKNGLVQIVSKSCGVSSKKAREMIDVYNNAIMESCENGEKVKVAKFGTYEGRKRKKRNGVNPKNAQEKIVIPECIMPYFKPSKLFRDRLNK